MDIEALGMRLAQLTVEDHARQHGPLTQFSGCRCERCEISRRILAKPIDPSPTPWDHSTWGFYCDTCERFIDLLDEGRVETDNVDKTIARYHKECGGEIRYIGYDHEAVRVGKRGL